MINRFDFQYNLSISVARLRASALKGCTSIFKGETSRLFVGNRVSIVAPRSDEGRIDLVCSDGFSTNELNPPFLDRFPSATQIGLPPHWRFLNPGQSRDTRILLLKAGTLRLHENVVIAPGVYISVGNGSVLSIGPHSYIGHDSQLNSRSSLSIGSGCLIGQRVQIMDYDGHPIISDGNPLPEDTYGGRDAPVTIGANVWVGFGAMIFKGVTIGDGAIIGAGSVVRKNVPPRSMVVGNPASVVREGVTWRKF